VARGDSAPSRSWDPPYESSRWQNIETIIIAPPYETRWQNIEAIINARGCAAP
jgi:hypothetical protein